MKVEDVIEAAAKLCREFGAKKVILFGSRAKGTALERSDIDIAVLGVENTDLLIQKIKEMSTLYSMDIVKMDDCKKELLREDIRQYGREI